MAQRTAKQRDPFGKLRAGSLPAAPARWDGRGLPAHYGDPVAEYAALLQGTALVDRSSVGRLRFSGADGLDLLNRLSTNQLDSPAPGEGKATVATTNKGRVVDLLLVTARLDHLLCMTSPGRQPAVMEWIEFYTFSEDVRVEELTPATALLGLTGPQAGQVLTGLGAPVGDLPRFHSRDALVGGVGVLIWHTFSSGAETYELMLPREKAAGLWEGLVAGGAIPAGREAWEAFRVVQGVPVYGSEFGKETNPLESGLGGAISFNKGCYVGQEVVARLNTYSKVQRRLMAAALSGPASPGDSLLAEGRSVGRLTSVARIPGDGSYKALALVRQEAAVAGGVLSVSTGPVTATLSEPADSLAPAP